MGSQVNRLWALQPPIHARARHTHSGPGSSIVAADWEVCVCFFFFVSTRTGFFLAQCGDISAQTLNSPGSHPYPHFTSPGVISVEPMGIAASQTFPSLVSMCLGVTDRNPTSLERKHLCGNGFLCSASRLNISWRSVFMTPSWLDFSRWLLSNLLQIL